MRFGNSLQSAELAEIEALDAGSMTLPAALKDLRKLSFEAFGELLLMLPEPSLPNLSRLLPAATPPEIQEQWTGSSDMTLLRQSMSFIRFLVSEYQEQSRCDIADALVLDFGVGWGRLMRLLPYFIDPPSLYGIDPWQVSLDHAITAGVLGNLALSEAEPDQLPFGSVRFDLIFAFSVFTHISVRAASKCLAAMRARISPNGVAIISVRPIGFWEYYGRAQGADYRRFKAAHATNGFAYLPSAPGAAYGDISMTRAYLETIAIGWRIVRMEATPIDPYQLLVTLRPI